MRKLLFILITALFYLSHSQSNCSVYSEDSGERKACELSHEAIKHKQGSRASQELFDSAIEAGPEFAWAYYEKSVPYFKRGFLNEGLKILNKAVKINPLDYLCYRAYWYWQYRNYKLCIEDLETYYALPKAYYQTTPGGEKDMRIILGLAYAKNGDFKNGIEVISDCMSNYEKEIDYGYADYLSLGMLYYFNNEYDNAISALKNQLLVIEHTAEAHYFLGLSYKEKGNISTAKIHFNKAKEIFESVVNRFHNINAGFIIFLTDVEDELKKINATNEKTDKL